MTTQDENQYPFRPVGDPTRVLVLHVENPFEPHKHTKRIIDWHEGLTVAEAIEGIPLTETTVVSVSGKIILPEQYATELVPGGHTVVVMPVPADGEDVKSVLRIVLVIAAFAAGQWWASTLFEAGSFGYWAVAASVTAAGALLINALLPPQLPSLESMESSPSYGLDGAKLVAQEGIQVPVCYGRFRMAGNLIAMHVENVGEHQYLYMLINAGEGPIAGISDIEINEQPISNFEDVTYEIRLGTADQEPIGWFNRTLTPVNKGVVLDTSFVTHTVTNDIDRFRLDFVAPSGLVEYDKKGRQHPVTVELEVQYRPLGSGGEWISLTNQGMTGGYTPLYLYYEVRERGVLIQPERRVTELDPGHTVDPLTRQIKDQDGRFVGIEIQQPVYLAGLSVTHTQLSPYRWSILSPQLPQGKYEVRVRRKNAETVSNTKIDRVQWVDFVEIVEDRVAYRHTALLGLRIRLDDQLSSIPNVTFINHGRIIPVWENGQWVTDQPSDNPAWVAFDALTHTRYGAGIPESRFDMDRWKEWGEYCRTQGLTFRGVFDQRDNIWDQLQHVYRAGHARPVNIGTKYSVAVEKPTSPSMMFTVGNIIKGSFSQQWLGSGSIANEIEVSYFDEEDRNKKRTIKVYDDSVAAGAPQNTAHVTLYGITTAERATEEAIFQLKLNKYLRSTISFRAPIEAIACTVGDVVLVQHDQPNWAVGGRLEAGSTTTVLRLDRPVTLQSGVTYKALVHYSALVRVSGTVASVVGNHLTLNGYTGETNVDRIQVAGKDLRITGTTMTGVTVEDAAGISPGANYQLFQTDAIEMRTVTNGPGEHTQLTLDTSLPEAPPQFANFMVGPVQTVTKEWRIISIDGDTSDLTRKITCIEYNPAVYDWTSNIGGVVQPPSDYTQAVPHVTHLAAAEAKAVIGDIFRPVVDLSWRAPINFPEYDGVDIFLSIDNGPYELVAQVRGSRTSYRYEAILGQTLKFQVVTHARDGRVALKSSAPTVTITTGGDQIAPDPPTNVTLIQGQGGLTLGWENPDDGDFRGIEIRRATVNDFEQAVTVQITDKNAIKWTDSLATNPALQYYYWLRSLDWSDNASGWVRPNPISASPAAPANVVVFLTNEAHTLAADSSGVITGYADANGYFKVYDGGIDVSGLATFSVQSQVNCQGTIDTAGYYQVTEVTADTASLVLRATYNGVSFDKVFSISVSRAGSAGPASAVITLTASSQVFTYDNSTGTPTPSPAQQTINFQAHRQNLPILPTWTVFDENDNPITPPPLSNVSGDTAQLTIENFGLRNRVKVRVTAGTLYDEITIVRLQSGMTGAGQFGLTARGNCYATTTTIEKVGGATNWDSDCFSVESFQSGAFVSFSRPDANGRVMVGLTQDPLESQSFDTIDYAIYPRNDGVLFVYHDGVNQHGASGVGNWVPGDQFTVIYDNRRIRYLHNGNEVYSASAPPNLSLHLDSSFADPGTKITNVRFGPVGAAGEDGQDGAPAVTLELSKYIAAVIAYANGSAPSYAEAQGIARVFEGDEDVTASASLSATASPGLTGTINNAANTPVPGQQKGFYRVTNLTTDSGTLTITAVYKGRQYQKVFTVTKVKVGYEIWSGETLPTTDLFEGRMVYWTVDNKLYRYDGSKWTAEVPAVDIVGQISSSQIGDGAVTASKLNVSIGGGNLVPNSSFEAASGSTPLYWTQTGIGTGITTTWEVVEGTPTPHGRRFARFAVTAVAPPTSQSSHSRYHHTDTIFPVVEGRKYVASCYLRTSTLAYRARLRVMWYDINRTQFAAHDGDTHTFSATDAWERYVSGGFTAPPGAVFGRIGLSLVRPNANDTTLGYIDVDAIQFEEGEIATAYAPAASELLPGTITGDMIADAAITAAKMNVNIGGGNLLPNSGAEAWSNGANNLPDDWLLWVSDTGDGSRTYAISRVSAIAPLGNYAVRVQITGASNANDSALQIDGNHRVVPGQPYVVSAYVRTNASNRVRLVARAYNGSGTQIADYYSSLAAGDQSTQRLSVKFTPGTNVAWVRVFVRGINGVGQWFEVDGVQLEAGEVLTAYAPRPDEILPGTVGTTQIADNAVTTEKVVAGAITAGKIAAGAIQASHIAAGAITTEKLAVTGRGAALNDDPACSDLSAWVTWGGGGTIATISDGVAGTTCLRSASNSVWWVTSRRVPFDPNKRYRVRARARNVGGNGTFYLVAALFDVSGNNISGDGTMWFYAASAVVPPSGTFAEYMGEFGSGTVRPFPSNARTMAVGVILNYNGTAGYMEAQDVRLEEMIGTTLIADGAIVTNKIGAQAITADKVAAGAITAGKIAAGAVGANEIAANAINSNHIAVNTLNGNRIAAGTITGDRIQAGAITSAHLATTTLITQSAQIADGIITGAKIGNAQITTAKIADGQITSAKIGDLQVNSIKIANDAIVTEKILNEAVTAIRGSFSNAIQNLSGGTNGTLAATNAIATITTSGRPVLVMWGIRVSHLTNTTPAGLVALLYRIDGGGNTTIDSVAHNSVDVSNWLGKMFDGELYGVVDNVPAGTYTYRPYVYMPGASGNWQVTRAVVVAVELKK